MSCAACYVLDCINVVLSWSLSNNIRLHVDSNLQPIEPTHFIPLPDFNLWIKIWQNLTKSDNIWQNMTISAKIWQKHDKIWLNVTKIWQNVTTSDKIWQKRDKIWQYLTISDKTWQNATISGEIFWQLLPRPHGGSTARDPTSPTRGECGRSPSAADVAKSEASTPSFSPLLWLLALLTEHLFHFVSCSALKRPPKRSLCRHLRRGESLLRESGVTDAPLCLWRTPNLGLRSQSPFFLRFAFWRDGAAGCLIAGSSHGAFLPDLGLEPQTFASTTIMTRWEEMCDNWDVQVFCWSFDVP